MVANDWYACEVAGATMNTACFFFAMFLLVANRVNDGVLVGEDYIILTDFYAFSALPWIFVKIDFYDSGVSTLSANELNGV